MTRTPPVTLATVAAVCTSILAHLPDLGETVTLKTHNHRGAAIRWDYGMRSGVVRFQWTSLTVGGGCPDALGRHLAAIITANVQRLADLDATDPDPENDDYEE